MNKTKKPKTMEEWQKFRDKALRSQIGKLAKVLSQITLEAPMKHETPENMRLILNTLRNGCIITYFKFFIEMFGFPREEALDILNVPDIPICREETKPLE